VRSKVENSENRRAIPHVCHACVIDQARSAARFAALDEEQTRRVMAVARRWLKRAETQHLLVQHVVRKVADAVIAERGAAPDFDIYAEVKAHSNTLALAAVDGLERQIAASDSPLETGLQIAAAGNIIDFGANSKGNLDLEKALGSLTEIAFARYDIAPFKKALAGAENLLYLCDNSGEIVFDMLLIKTLRRLYPQLSVAAAVRHRPIINDATLADARAVGLDLEAETLSSGSVYPGTILAETSEAFRRRFEAAGVILSKGQGNFETLLPRADARLFFLLRIKCEAMATLSRVATGALVLLQGGDPAMVE
jgi:uncharacterized protein with ATP-grasp and redox domains